MVNVYTGDYRKDSSTWELLFSSLELAEANAFASRYIQEHVPNVVYIRQFPHPATIYETNVVDYGHWSNFIMVENKK